MTELGLGLIGIGRPWGFRNPEVPPESAAMELLERALELGITWFDTAASYGCSEQRVGRFLRRLSPSERQRLTVATKFGEHWDAAKNEPYIDHSFDALRRSLDRSLDLLGPIDVLQLHKTNPDVLRSDDLHRAWEYAKSQGVTRIGPSVADLESARVALDDSYHLFQLPYNLESTQFANIIDEAGARRIAIAANRPFGMGKLLYDGVDKVQAFAFVLERVKHGVVLTGTKSAAHLEENVGAFRRSRSASSSAS